MVSALRHALRHDGADPIPLPYATTGSRASASSNASLTASAHSAYQPYLNSSKPTTFSFTSERGGEYTRANSGSVSDRCDENADAEAQGITLYYGFDIAVRAKRSARGGIR